MIVEADMAVRSALAFALEAEGFAVQPLASASAVGEAAGLAGVDCLIIDQSLGDLSGLDLLARLRAEGAVQPAVILMARAAAGLMARAERLGALVVEKPLLDNQLFGAIRRLVGPAGPVQPPLV